MTPIEMAILKADLEHGKITQADYDYILKQEEMTYLLNIGAITEEDYKKETGQ